MSKIHSLTHLTDVGSPEKNGNDSTRRIEKQYQRLGVQNPNIINAGESPFEIAFSAATDLSSQARENARKVLQHLNIHNLKINPVALNSAPRNSSESHDNGKEDHIFLVKTSEENADYLIYGPGVLKWITTFHNDVLSVSRILFIGENGDIIPDTSEGSQFRSGEHLPIAHVLHAHGELENFSQQEIITELPKQQIIENSTIIAPSDEYNNGRLIVNNDTLDNVLSQGKISIPGIAEELSVTDSLTNVIPGKLSVWVSSNNFHNKFLSVLNIGTRWQEGTTKTTDSQVLNLANVLKNSSGKSFNIKY